MLNAPGTIDSDYRGEVKVLLINHGPAPFTVTAGMRVAQLVVARVARVEWEPVEGLTPSSRGEGGFGHTGSLAHPSWCRFFVSMLARLSSPSKLALSTALA